MLKKGRPLRASNLTVKYIEGQGGKAAVVVSKKIARTAVRRNAIRRSIYGALPRPFPSGAHVVFLVQKSILDYTSDIKTICSKLFS